MRNRLPCRPSDVGPPRMDWTSIVHSDTRIREYISVLISFEVLIITSLCVPQHPGLQASSEASHFLHILSITHIEAIYQSSTLTMASTEMIQTGAPLSLAQPSTPPSSPNLLSSEHIVTLSNVQQFIEMVKAMEVAPNTLASKCTCSHMPPESPNPQASTRALTFQDLERLILKLTEARSADSAGISEDPKPTSPGDTQPEDVVAEASRLEFKTVDELYVSNGVPVPSQLTSTLIQLGQEGS